MLYVHKLSDLNMRLADIESIAFIREIKARMILPVSSQNIYEYLSSCLISEQDIEAAEEALAELNPALEQIKNLLDMSEIASGTSSFASAKRKPAISEHDQNNTPLALASGCFDRKDALYEPINLLRTLQMLQQIPAPLANNIQYLKEVLSMQAQLINESAPLLNAIPSLNTREEKAKADAALSGFFEKILRNREFFFRHQDIVYEAQTSIMSALEESMSKGYFFHVTLEEEMVKADFASIKLRIPAENLNEAEEIRQKLLRIKRGVDSAYNANMKMVTCAVLLYSCVKWANSRQGY